MTKRFAGKSFVLTGAAQGIGRQVALLAGSEGAKLTLIDRSPLVEDVAAEIKAAGGKAITALADLETYAGNQAALEAAHAKYGSIDILVTNVGGAIWMKPFEEFDEAQIEAEIRRSLFPTLWGTRAVLPYMLAQGHGSIVCVSSIATRGINRMPYSAAKGGVNALVQSLAFEVAGKNIRVNATAPGGTDAPPRAIPRSAGLGHDQKGTHKQTAKDKKWVKQVVDQTVESSLMHRYGTLDEQAEAILFLASDAASYITGTILPVGGGDLG
jgi:dihydroxycyclohexadiene carboxylate dehydrogenase